MSRNLHTPLFKERKSNFWIAVTFLLIILAFAFLLQGCSPQSRLSNLLKRHPELFKRDTVFISDTTIIPPASTDTVIYYKQTDTVIVKENGVTVKYFYNIKDSTVYLKGERDTITIIQQVPVSVNSVSVEPETILEKAWRTIKDFLIIALLLVALVLIYLQRKRI